MPVTLTSSRNLTIKETTTEGVKVLSDQFSGSSTPKWVSSAGALGITKQWSDGERLLNATNETHDLAGTGLLNGFGVAVVFAKIKKFWVKNTGTGNITLDTTLTNGWQAMFNGIQTLPPGASVDLECPDTNGWAVTATTADLLKVTASGAGGKYEIALAGE